MHFESIFVRKKMALKTIIKWLLVLVLEIRIKLTEIILNLILS